MKTTRLITSHRDEVDLRVDAEAGDALHGARLSWVTIVIRETETSPSDPPGQARSRSYALWEEDDAGPHDTADIHGTVPIGDLANDDALAAAVIRDHLIRRDR